MLAGGKIKRKVNLRKIKKLNFYFYLKAVGQGSSVI
jgi:hypothetical protein